LSKETEQFQLVVSDPPPRAGATGQRVELTGIESTIIWPNNAAVAQRDPSDDDLHESRSATLVLASSKVLEREQFLKRTPAARFC
jgi:hypothetical protein